MARKAKRGPSIVLFPPLPSGGGPGDPITSRTPACPLLPWWREVIFMVDGVPPPYEPPMADEAPPFLASFIYFLTKDFVPFGVVDYALARARERMDPVPPSPVKDYAERIARELAYKPTPVEE